MDDDRNTPVTQSATVPLSVRFPAPLLEAFRAAVEQEYDTPSNVLRMLAREYVRQHRNGDGS